MAKRAAPQEDGTLIKRARSSEPEANSQQLAISSSNDERQKALVRSVKRTSNLDAPIVSLSGAHAVSFQCQCFQGTQGNVVIQAEILSCRFDPTGQNIAACSADRGICMYHNFFWRIAIISGMPPFSLMANIPSEYQLWPPFDYPQGASVGSPMVAFLTPSLHCLGRSHSCIYRFDYGAAHSKTPCPP